MINNFVIENFLHLKLIHLLHSLSSYDLCFSFLILMLPQWARFSKGKFSPYVSAWLYLFIFSSPPCAVLVTHMTKKLIRIYPIFMYWQIQFHFLEFLSKFVYIHHRIAGLHFQKNLVDSKKRTCTMIA